MRPKAELTEKARAQIEQVLQEMQSEDMQTRLNTRDKIRRLKALYGDETLQLVEEQYAERLQQETYDAYF